MQVPADFAAWCRALPAHDGALLAELERTSVPSGRGNGKWVPDPGDGEWMPDPGDGPPGDDELWEREPDPDSDPPDGPDSWLADVPAELWIAYMDATRGPQAPETLRPGLWNRDEGDGAGFAAGGVADTLAPGVVLAALADGAWPDGLAGVSDDELIGVMRAWRRLTSWAQAGELAAVAELDRRRTAQVAAGADPYLAEHVGDELAAPLTLTSRAADRLLDFALALGRLPLTRAALAAGEIDRAKAQVITDEVTGLDGPHAAAVEAAVIGRAPRMTTGQLRAATRRAVMTADPAAARRRREAARKDARVEVWDEQAGTAALAGRDLPPADVLAADKRISALARQLKTSGAEGTLDQLRAKVYTALLTGRPGDLRLPDQPVSGGSPDSPARPAPAGGGVTGSVNLTMPLATWLGSSEAPGDVPGFGPVPAGDARALARLLATQPGSKWCLTLTDATGRAVAHGCARPVPFPGQPGPRPLPGDSGPGPGSPGPGPPTGPSPGVESQVDEPAPGAGTVVNRRALPPSHGPVPETGPATGTEPAPRAGTVVNRRAPSPPHGSVPETEPATGSDPPMAGLPGRPGKVTGGFRLTVTVRPLAVGWCGHERESRGYRPSSALRHILDIRHQRCGFPGCRRPATQCDQDHTLAYGQGGRTCECGMAPLCRRHHRAKQAQGWRLIQPEPGVLLWLLPHGRSYRVEPEPYPV